MDLTNRKCALIMLRPPFEAKMQIRVKVLLNNRIEFDRLVEMEPELTVRQMQDKLIELFSLEQDRCRILFMGKALPIDDSSISSHGIRDGLAIHVVERPPAADRIAPTTFPQAEEDEDMPGWEIPVPMNNFREALTAALGDPRRAFGQPNQDHLPITTAIAVVRQAAFIDRSLVENILRDAINAMDYLPDGIRNNISIEWRDSNVVLRLPQLSNPHIASPAMERLHAAENTIYFVQHFRNIVDSDGALMSMVERILNRESYDNAHFNTEAVNIAVRLETVPELPPRRGAYDRMEEASPSDREQRFQVHSASGSTRPFVTRHIITSDVSDVLSRLQEEMRLLQPHLDVYRRVLTIEERFNSDPSITRNGAANVLCVFMEHVQRVLHRLSHALHAISDLNIHLDEPFPRRLYPQFSNFHVNGHSDGEVVIDFVDSNRTSNTVVRTRPAADLLYMPVPSNDIRVIPPGVAPLTTLFPTGIVQQVATMTFPMEGSVNPLGAILNGGNAPRPIPVAAIPASFNPLGVVHRHSHSSSVRPHIQFGMHPGARPHVGAIPAIPMMRGGVNRPTRTIPPPSALRSSSLPRIPASTQTVPPVPETSGFVIPSVNPPVLQATSAGPEISHGIRSSEIIDGIQALDSGSPVGYNFQAAFASLVTMLREGHVNIASSIVRSSGVGAPIPGTFIRSPVLSPMARQAAQSIIGNAPGMRFQLHQPAAQAGSPQNGVSGSAGNPPFPSAAPTNMCPHMLIQTANQVARAVSNEMDRTSERIAAATQRATSLRERVMQRRSANMAQSAPTPTPAGFSPPNPIPRPSSAIINEQLIAIDPFLNCSSRFARPRTRTQHSHYLTLVGDRMPHRSSRRDPPVEFREFQMPLNNLGQVVLSQDQPAEQLTTLVQLAVRSVISMMREHDAERFSRIVPAVSDVLNNLGFGPQDVEVSQGIQLDVHISANPLDAENNSGEHVQESVEMAEGNIVNRESETPTPAIHVIGQPVEIPGAGPSTSPDVSSPEAKKRRTEVEPTPRRRRRNHFPSALQRIMDSDSSSPAISPTSHSYGYMLGLPTHFRTGNSTGSSARITLREVLDTLNRHNGSMS